jgi:hypothetical protein
MEALMPRARSATPCALALCALALTQTGCGSSATPKPSSGLRGHAPAAAVTAARAWTRAVATGKCAVIAQLNYIPLLPARCRALLRSTPAPMLVAVAEYGPVLVTDLKLSTGGRAAAIFLLDGVEGWRFASTIGTRRPIDGTHPLNERVAAAMLARVLPALAKGSCTKVASDFLAPSPASVKRSAAKPRARRQRAAVPTAANCFGLTGTRFQKLLKEGMGSPVLLGANARVAFYRLDTGTGLTHPYTLFVLAQDEAPILFRVFIDVPRAAALTKP